MGTRNATSLLTFLKESACFLAPPYTGQLRRLGERAFVRPSIHQALALRALNDLGNALRILDAKRGTIRVAKIELSQIAVQVLLAAMLINALHAALEDRVVALD